VITFDPSGNLRSANQAACELLDLDLNYYRGQKLESIASEPTAVKLLFSIALNYFNGEKKQWNEEVSLMLGEQIHTFMCKGNHLPDRDTQTGGYVLVFDDITSLIQAKKDTAWSDVARRLAHEIKNPLTPIQLSAERLQHKYQNKLGEKDLELLNKSTNTIINQVESMKGMVRDFSDYAKPAKSEFKPIDFNQLLLEVAELYKNHDNSTLQLSLGTQAMSVMADKDRLRQLLHNLIKNAFEANDKQQGKIVYVSTRKQGPEQREKLELLIEDQGPGISEEMMPQLFEPYVTSKTKGTGLGLAIVKKIVEEHSGDIKVHNLNDGGALFILHFPLANNSAQTQTGDETS
jgi:nitrogen fixation/metabolism regulation signal transduction histidine kinase